MRFRCIPFFLLFFVTFSFGAPLEPVVQIDDPSKYSQVLAVSDVHGMNDSLLSLLKKGKVVDLDGNWSAGKTLFIVVGDSIDKGDNSIGVLETLMKLTEQAHAVGGRVVTLLGNHEAELLAYGKHSKKADDLFSELDRKGIKKKYFLSEESKWGKFLHSLPVAARVGRWLFCHAGLYPEMKWGDFLLKSKEVTHSGNYNQSFLVGNLSILEAKDWWSTATNRAKLLKRLNENGISGIVQGHQPKAYDISFKIGAIEKGWMIKIDNGMSPDGGGHPGSLLKFGMPSEMTTNSLPKVEVINDQGAIEPLKIR